MMTTSSYYYLLFCFYIISNITFVLHSTALVTYLSKLCVSLQFHSSTCVETSRLLWGLELNFRNEGSRSASRDQSAADMSTKELFCNCKTANCSRPTNEGIETSLLALSINFRRGDGDTGCFVAATAENMSDGSDSS